MPIHHVSFGTNNLDRAQAFYDPLIEIIGCGVLKYRTGCWAMG